MYADINRSVLSRWLKVTIVSVDLVDGDRVFQTVGAAIENDLSAQELMSGGRCSLGVVHKGRPQWREAELAQMRTRREWGSDCIWTSATLLGTKVSRAGIQQCMAILITTIVTVLAVLNRLLWSLNLSELRCDMQRWVSHKPSISTSVFLFVRIGERRGLVRCRQKRTGGGGFKNLQIFADVFYGRPLIGSLWTQSPYWVIVARKIM